MYNDIIITNFTAPTCSGELTSPDVTFMVGNSVCGDRIEIALNTESQSITEAKFQAWGCATSVATANIFCNAITGKSASQIQQWSVSDMAPLLGELEPSQQHCVAILEGLFAELTKRINSTHSEMTFNNLEAEHVSAT